MQLFGAQSIKKEKHDFLIRAQGGWRKAVKSPVGRMASPGLDNGSHQIDGIPPMVIRLGKITKAQE